MKISAHQALEVEMDGIRRRDHASELPTLSAQGVEFALIGRGVDDKVLVLPHRRDIDERWLNADVRILTWNLRYIGWSQCAGHVLASCMGGGGGAAA